MKTKKRLVDRVRETPPEYGSQRTLSATEASRNFSEVMNRVKYRGESFIIERGGERICEVRPAAAREVYRRGFGRASTLAPRRR